MSDKDHAPDVKLYMVIFGSLLVLTVVTVLVSYWHLPPVAAIAVGLTVASIKAGLVVAFFMHLKGEKALIFYCLGVMLFCMIGFFLVPLDFHLVGDMNTHSKVEAGHHGAAHEEKAHEEQAEPAHAEPMKTPAKDMKKAGKKKAKAAH